MKNATEKQIRELIEKLEKRVERYKKAINELEILLLALTGKER